MRIGTRGSPLALAQAALVARAFVERFPDRSCEIVTIRTEGDRDQVRSLMTGGEGLFVKELERALLDGRVDAAVHSAKDLSVSDPEGIELAAFLPRAPAHDVLVRQRPAAPGSDIPGPGFVLATGSPRRRAQLADRWPGVEFVEVRGNVETRLARLAAGDADALVLAAAGIRRLGLDPAGMEPIPIEVCVPAPGQAAIAIQGREADPLTADLRWLNHLETSLAVQAERDLALALGAGCSTPLGAHVHFSQARGVMRAALHDGTRLHRVEVAAPAGEPATLVQLATAELRDRGAFAAQGGGG